MALLHGGMVLDWHTNSRMMELRIIRRDLIS